MTIEMASLSTVGEPAGVLVSPRGHWSGFNGSVGFYQCFPPTLNKGFINWACADNAGNFGISFTNASFGQATVVTAQDPGVAAANLTMDLGTVAAGVGASSPGSLMGVTQTLKFVRAGVTYYIPLYAVNT